jgi:hypothetical protein
MIVENILENAIDMHVHCAPDIRPMYGDSVEIATIAKDAGMRGIVLKDHLTQTVHKAIITNELVPGFECFGSAVMNQPAGGLSPRAASFFTVLGAKVIWIPTLDSAFTWFKANQDHYEAIYATRFAFGIDYKKLTLLTGGMFEGRLRDEVKQIVDVVAKAGVVLCSGHHTPQETTALSEYAKAIGFNKILVTHVNAFLEEFTPNILDKLVKLGATLEISYEVLGPLHGRQDPKEVLKIIRQVGPDKVVLVSDAGQLENPSPPETLRSFSHILIKEGVAPEEIRTMIVDNPTRLMTLEPVKEGEK